MPARRTRSSAIVPVIPRSPPSITRRTSSRVLTHAATVEIISHSPEILDSEDALRPVPVGNGTNTSEVPQSPGEVEEPARKKRRTAATVKQASPTTPGALGSMPSTLLKAVGDAEGVVPGVEGEDGATADELLEAVARRPPVNSSYLPLPWKGRLGYACLNTYLRASNPPVFSSRTCRIASIIEHRHPLADPSQPEHATKNRPDRDEPASIEQGRRYVEAIGLANARDIIKMVRWNDRYNIKFMRLSSEMFPFASHEEYGYKLAPFASQVLAEAGKAIAELGHRVSTHPGQFTQLGSPRTVVVENAIRDLDYHDEMLSLLKLPEQQDKDAIMVLHMGGVFGDKEATLDRFRENYARLSQGVKNRLVLENDDVSYSVHDLLPICQELNIPMLLDYHHHNIIFDDTKVREGTLDVMNLYDEISETWKRKGITQKMHYSEPTVSAITARQRRKHSPRVMTLPPCDPTMDLMIEAKDKEQAVFELMRTFKLPGFETISDINPYQRSDESKPAKPPLKKKTKRKKKAAEDEEDEPPPDLGTPAVVMSEEDRSMGGVDGRVYWPLGMEEWLRPPKRVIKKKDDADGGRPAAAPAKKKQVKGKGSDVKKGVAKNTKKKKEDSIPPTSEDDELSDMPSDLSAEEVVPVSKRVRVKTERSSPPVPARRPSRKIREANV